MPKKIKVLEDLTVYKTKEIGIFFNCKQKKKKGSQSYQYFIFESTTLLVRLGKVMGSNRINFMF